MKEIYVIIENVTIMSTDETIHRLFDRFGFFTDKTEAEDEARRLNETNELDDCYFFVRTLYPA